MTQPLFLMIVIGKKTTSGAKLDTFHVLCYDEDMK